MSSSYYLLIIIDGIMAIFRAGSDQALDNALLHVPGEV